MLLAALVDMTMRERAELQQAAHRMAQRRMTDLGLGGSPVFHSLQARMQLLQVARLRILGSQGALLRCAVLSLHGLAHRHVVVPCSALGSRQSISAPAACSHGMPGPELVQAGCIGASTLGAVGKCEAGTVGKWRMPHQSMVQQGNYHAHLPNVEVHGCDLGLGSIQISVHLREAGQPSGHLPHIAEGAPFQRSGSRPYHTPTFNWPCTYAPVL